MNHLTSLPNNKILGITKFVLLPGIVLLNHILLSTLPAEENFSSPALKDLTPSKKSDYHSIPHEQQQICTASAHFIAAKKPSKQFTRITTESEWSAFTKEHIGKLVSEELASQFSSSENWDPESVIDFSKQQVLVFFAEPTQSAEGFADIEIYQFESTLKAFVFHHASSNYLNLLPKNNAAIGTFYIAIMPKINYLIAPEFHFAAQTWGRPCSDFYPPFKTALLNDSPQKPHLREIKTESGHANSDPIPPQSNG